MFAFTESGILKTASKGTENYANAQIYEQGIMDNVAKFASKVVANITGEDGGDKGEEQTPSGEPGIYAKSYADGTLILSSLDYTDTSRGEVTSYGDISNKTYADNNLPEWHDKGIKNVIVYGKISPTSTAFWFATDYSTESTIETIDLAKLDTTNVTDMSGMFQYCKKLSSIDVSNFSTKMVKSMRNMFLDCRALKYINVSGFDTTSVTDMQSMFEGCRSISELDLAGFGTSNVFNLCNFLKDCAGLTSIDLSGFDTSKVEGMSSMFEGCYNLHTIDVSDFDTHAVWSMDYMFKDCNSLENVDLSGFDTSRVALMNSMFEGCSNLLSVDLGGSDNCEAFDTSGMFAGCASLKAVVLPSFSDPDWYTRQARGMFLDCYNLESFDMSCFKTCFFVDATGMFENCASLVSLNLNEMGSNTADRMLANCSSLRNLELGTFTATSITGFLEGCHDLEVRAPMNPATGYQIQDSEGIESLADRNIIFTMYPV